MTERIGLLSLYCFAVKVMVNTRKTTKIRKDHCTRKTNKGAKERWASLTEQWFNKHVKKAINNSESSGSIGARNQWWNVRWCMLILICCVDPVFNHANRCTKKGELLSNTLRHDCKCNAKSLLKANAGKSNQGWEK